MMYASNNGGVLVGTKGIMIDTGNGYPEQLQYLQAVSTRETLNTNKR